MPRRTPRSTGFTLLPVVLAMSVVGAIAFLLNRDNGVNVNLIAAQSDRERARYAAEAGLQAANFRIQAKACAGGYPILSLPVTDNDFGGATYSAYANRATVPPVGSSLALTSIGTYNGASVKLTKVTVFVFQPVTQTWRTQAGADTAVVAGSPDSNYGSSPEISLDGSGTDLLIRFDGLSPLPLLPLPTGSKIVGANLMLHRNNAGVATEWIYVMLITRSWSDATATWIRYDGVNNWPSPGVGYDARPVSINPFLTVSTNPYSTATNWQSLDLTNAAIAWRNGLYPNNGVWIRGGPLVNNAKFALSNDVTPTNRPMLVVSYLLPCGATAPPSA